MVFLVEDFVNLPADQIANIWIAAHMKKKLQKKDIKKTKLGEACEQLHSDKTKKPMQLRHYGQCLIGISWIHYKQVEYLHSDCNEAFSKARLVLVRKRNVDLDPSKDRGRDITLPEQGRHGNHNQGDNALIIDIDLNENNMSQLMLQDIDNMSDVGSLLGTDSHCGAGKGSIAGRDHLAMDHEITMQQNELSTISPSRRNGIGMADRRSSFGGISSLLMADMDIEIEFDDDEDNEHKDDMLDESQAQRASAEQLASLTDDENGSVEQGRGAINHTLLPHDNMSDNGSIGIQPVVDGQGISLLDDVSHVSLEKEKAANLDDLGSVHSGSVVLDQNAMQIDDQSVHDQPSLHVTFDVDAQSINGSVATAMLEQKEEATPPPSPGARDKSNKQRKKDINNQRKRGKKIKRKKRKKFTMDKAIEIEDEELRERDPDRFDFCYPTGRDALHIWREFPLSSLDFDSLFTQPLSKQHFGKLPADISKKFAQCNQKQVNQKKQQNLPSSDDPLCDPNILRESDDVEQGRDDQQQFDGLNDIALPMNDFPMNDLNEPLDVMDDRHSAVHEPAAGPLPFDADNASTIDSVVDDNIPPPPEMDAEPLQIEQVEHEDMDEDVDEDEDDDLLQDKENRNNSNRLSFDTGDQDEFSQVDRNENGDVVQLRSMSKRAKKTFAFFKNQYGKQFSFDDVMKTTTKKDTVVGVFYELLVFKNMELVDLQQDEPYGDIKITKTANFDRHARRSRKVSKRISEIQQSQQQMMDDEEDEE